MSAYNPFLPYDDSRDADESTTDHTVEFDELVQKLKRAYCDAYMTSLRFAVSGDRYINLVFDYGPHNMKISDVSRPSATGEGGGIKLEPECKGHDYIETFNGLRAEVEQAVRNYRHLPMGSPMLEACSHCDSWARSLSPHVEDSAETLAGWIDLTKRILENLHSITLRHVSVDMVGKISPALSILQQAAFATTSLISTNRHAILTARYDIRQAMRVAIEACSSYTKYRIVAAMEIASTAFKISASVSDIMKGDLQGIGNSIDMVSGWLTVDEEIDWLSYYAILTPSAIISKLGEGLKTINSQLKQAETTIDKGFKDISSQLSLCEEQGQLRIDEQDHQIVKYTDQVELDWSELQRVHAEFLPQIALRLREVKSEAYSTPYPSAFSRSVTIGLGTSGAWPGLCDTLNLIQDCIERVAESCDGIAQGLHDFEQDMKATETDSTASIYKIRTTLGKYNMTSPKFPPPPQN